MYILTCMLTCDPQYQSTGVFILFNLILYLSGSLSNPLLHQSELRPLARHADTHINNLAGKSWPSCQSMLRARAAYFHCLSTSLIISWPLLLITQNDNIMKATKWHRRAQHFTIHWNISQSTPVEQRILWNTCDVLIFVVFFNISK